MDWPNWIMAGTSFCILILSACTFWHSIVVQRSANKTQKELHRLMDDMVIAMILIATPGRVPTGVELFHDALKQLEDYYKDHPESKKNRYNTDRIGAGT